MKCFVLIMLIPDLLWSAFSLNIHASKLEIVRWSLPESSRLLIRFIDIFMFLLFDDGLLWVHSRKMIVREYMRLIIEAVSLSVRREIAPPPYPP